MNQVMKCNGTSYHGNAGDDTENLMKNASIRFPFSFYYKNKPENQDVDAQRMTWTIIRFLILWGRIGCYISDLRCNPTAWLEKKLWCFEKHCKECNRFVEVRWPFLWRVCVTKGSSRDASTSKNFASFPDVISNWFNILWVLLNTKKIQKKVASKKTKS